MGAVIGLERQKRKLGSAGLRTYMLICLGSVLITIVSTQGFSIDPARIAAGIITATGFLGAGTIIASRGEVRGITTAASIWVVSAVGIAIALGFYFIAFITTILVLIILELWKLEIKLGLKRYQ